MDIISYKYLYNLCLFFIYLLIIFLEIQNTHWLFTIEKKTTNIPTKIIKIIYNVRTTENYYMWMSLFFLINRSNARNRNKKFMYELGK